VGVVETIVGKVLEFALTSLSKRPSSPSRAELLERIDRHVRDVEAWSRHVDLFGLFGEKFTDTDTIALAFAVPRKLTLRDEPAEKRNETDLLEGDMHFILLGDPGAGKTTTLKRLARHLFTTTADDESVQYPVVVRLRELGRGLYLEEQLARVYGLPAERKALTGRDDVAMRVMTGGELTIDVVKTLLEDTAALLLLDGLDEVPPDLRARTEQTIIEIALHCRAARLIVSCRSGDYTHTLDPLQPVEIAPLTAAQIRGIAALWSDDAEGFMSSLRAVPFKDLSSRPLFLGQLMVLYRSRGSIPSRPVDVYRRVVRLAVEEWDRQNVVRRSRYSEFDPDTKIDFLAALAHHLTYQLKSKVFTAEQFLDAYTVLHERFALPRREGRDVVAEVETHTGIFVEAGYQRYEFSHLSLQEYLCAYSLRNKPIGFDLLRALMDNPAPVAVAVALSTESSEWISAMFLNKLMREGKLKTYPLQSFFSRLLQERPILVPTTELGHSALRIRFELPDNPRDEYTADFLNLPAVLSATASALPAYMAEYTDKHHVRLTLRYPWQHRDDLVIPVTGTLFANELEAMIRDQPLALRRAPFDGAQRRAADMYLFADTQRAHSAD
jgi:DNA polymerase III delta prime subunit